MFDIQNFADFDYGLMSRADKDKLDSISSDTFVTKTEAADYTQQILDAVSSETAAVKADTQQILGNLLSKSEAAKYNQQLLSAIKKISTSGGGSSSLIPREVIVVESGSECTVTEAGLDIDATAGNATISFNSNAAGNGVLLGEGDNSITFGGTSYSNTVWGSTGNNVYYVGTTSQNNRVVDFKLETDSIHSSAIFAKSFVDLNSDTYIFLFNQNNTASDIVLDKLDSGTAAVQTASSQFVTIQSAASNGHVIKNYDNNISVNGSALNDIIVNTGDNVTICANDGKDIVMNYGDNCSISGVNATLYSYGENTTLYGNEDNIYPCKNDTISVVRPDNNNVSKTVTNISNDISVDVSKVRQYINTGSNVTLTGRDSNFVKALNLSDSVVTISGYNNFWSYGSNIFYNVPASRISYNYASHSTILAATAYSHTINNTGSYVSVKSSDGLDDINNTGSYVTIRSAGGSDNITNSGDYVKIYSGAGSDTITNSGDYCFINNSEYGTIYVNAKPNKVTQGVTISSALNRQSYIYLTGDTILSGEETVHGSHTLRLYGKHDVYGAGPDEIFYCNGDEITCTATNTTLKVVSGNYYFNLQNYAQSGTSYEMIDIGNGYYTIQAT